MGVARLYSKYIFRAICLGIRWLCVWSVRPLVGLVAREIIPDTDIVKTKWSSVQSALLPIRGTVVTIRVGGRIFFLIHRPIEVLIYQNIDFFDR